MTRPTNYRNMFSNRQGNSSEEVALLSALFDVLDQDGSGRLTFKELDCFGQALVENSEDDAERTASQYMCAALVEFCNALQRGGSTSCTKSQFCAFEPADFPAQHWNTMVGIIEYVCNTPAASAAILRRIGSRT